MATYSTAFSGTTPTGTDVGLTGLEYAASEPGCAIIQAYFADVEGFNAPPLDCTGVLRGSPTTQTPEKLLANSRASDATGITTTSNPTLGRLAVHAGYNQTTQLFGMVRSWHPPDPRQPFIAGEERVGQVLVAQADNPCCGFLVGAEPYECPTRPIRRRGRNRGAWFQHDFATGKRGVANSPTVSHLANGGGFRMIQTFDWIVPARPVSAALLGGGTVLEVALAGTLTTTGAILTQSNKLLGGTLTTAGEIITQTNRVLTGVLTTAGEIVTRTNKLLAGTLTTAGALTVVRVVLVTLTGTLTTAGAILTQTNKLLGGTLTTAGAIITQSNRLLTGALTTAGTLLTQVSRTFTGALTTAGEVTTRTSKLLAGTLTTAGVLTVVRVLVITLAGTLTTAGTLVVQPIIVAGAAVVRWILHRYAPPRR